MQATVSLLPVSLSLVHIPRRRLPALAHQVLRQVLHPHPAFLNITSNDIELSIFAEHHILNDFQPIARKDARRSRSEPVEISYDNWSVLQIDSHSDQLDNSGTRVHDLSALLAAAGISILYQSSYMSDFIFVKESRLKEAMDLFEGAGFHLYRSSSDDGDDDYDAPPSPANYSPTTDGPTSPASHTTTHSSTPKKGTVFTRNDTQNQNNFTKKSADEITRSDSPAAGTAASRHASPTAAEVHILPPDLACVGLSDEFGVDHWGLKIVKLVAFPDLIGPQSPRLSESMPATRSRSQSSSSYSYASSSTRSSHSSSDASRDSASSSESTFEDEDPYFDEQSKRDRDTDSTSLTSLATTNNEHETENTSASVKGGAKVRVGHLAPLSPIVPPEPKDRPRISVHTNGNTDSSRKSHRRRHRGEGAPDIETGPAPSSKSSRANSTKSAKSSRSQKSATSSSSSGTPFFGFTRTPEGSSLTAPTRVLAALFPHEERHMLICGSELDAADKWVEREARRAMGGADGADAEEDEDEDKDDEAEDEDEDDGEGRDVDEAEAGEEDEQNQEEDGGDFLGSRYGRGNRYRGRGASTQRGSQRSSWDSRSRGRGGRRSRSLHGGGAGGALKCLQVDLRRFGLDKHGLVNRFSRVLEENEINHMYSSTFKTANLLVDKRDALRAQALLRSC